MEQVEENARQADHDDPLVVVVALAGPAAAQMLDAGAVARVMVYAVRAAFLGEAENAA